MKIATADFIMRAVLSFLNQKKLFLLSLLPLKLKAVAQKCSVKTVFLEISEYLQKKPVPESVLI